MVNGALCKGLRVFKCLSIYDFHVAILVLCPVRISVKIIFVNNKIIVDANFVMPYYLSVNRTYEGLPK